MITYRIEIYSKEVLIGISAITINDEACKGNSERWALHLAGVQFNIHLDPTLSVKVIKVDKGG